MSTASPSDIHGVIDTSLSDSDIQSFLDDAAFEIGQAVDEDLSDAHQKQLEKHLAALKIVQSKDPALSETSVSGGQSLVYDGSTVEWLRGAVRQRDPSDTLASTAVRDADRHVSSTGDGG
jgi:hypothetical protein